MRGAASSSRGGSSVTWNRKEKSSSSDPRTSNGKKGRGRGGGVYLFGGEGIAGGAGRVGAGGRGRRRRHRREVEARRQRVQHGRRAPEEGVDGLSDFAEEKICKKKNIEHGLQFYGSCHHGKSDFIHLGHLNEPISIQILHASNVENLGSDLNENQVKLGTNLPSAPVTVE